MGISTFKGGVHPYDGKDLAKDQPIRRIKPKEILVYPLSQHIGAPASPIVAVGDTVLRGQKIAETGGFVSAPVFASVSGTVKAIEPRHVATGDLVNSIIIENDGEMKETDFHGVEDVASLSKEQIIEKVKEAGVVGMGGAGFPTHVKLSPKEPDKIEFIIANCAECEPYLTADYRRMLENPEELIGGMKIVLRLFDHAKGILGVEDNKPDCIQKLKELTKDEERIEVMPLKTKYPQGGERTLISAITGRKIYSAKLPADAGCIVDNISTVIAIYRAVCKQTPLITRVMTLTGDAFKTPINVNVRIGCNHADLVAEGEGFKQEPTKIISGGPMMGFAMFDLNVPVTKTSSSILALTRDEVAENEPTACIRCGRCVQACPGNLVPQKIAQAAMHNDYDTFVKLNGMECYECGSCTYVCPAKRPLTQTFKQARQYVAAQRRKK